ncbi:hypothetical protein HPP92_024335 [Vanilla planifolia]|uniref:Cyanobacterial aminoacyl-tRNA synthetase CAAD domain-containing protein n=1 Tax=Vanilla planifolia TaxID=51239 RepID=A0A835PPK5_VANPL|nr:hypothetical protein HPP92_024335 [Vanilla planifolia]
MATAAAASSTAAVLRGSLLPAAVLRGSLLPAAAIPFPPRSPLLLLPSSRRSLPATSLHLPDTCKYSSLKPRATSSSEETATSIETDELLADLKQKLPKLLELVGLGYTGWFVYRYLLFKSSRKELAEDFEALKKKIAGTE